MTATHLHPDGSAEQRMPLALIFYTRLLLTENASVGNDGFPSAVRVETLNRLTATRKGINGYRHYGIND